MNTSAEKKFSGSKWPLWIGIVAVVIAIVWFFSYISSRGSEQVTPQAPVIPVTDEEEVIPVIEEEVISVTDEEGIAHIIRQALDNRDSDLCNIIGKEDSKQYCLVNVFITKAIDARDPAMCNEVQDENRRTACKDNIVFVNARDAEDPLLCKTLRDKTRESQCRKEAGE